MIRGFRPEDADGIAELLRAGEVPAALTGDGLRHWHAAQPERARVGSWVAVGGDRVDGWARARLNWATSAEGVGEVWVFVHPERRGAGLGGRLYDRAAAHLDDAGARVLESWALAEHGGRFLVARGFRPVRTERLLRLELASAETSSLAPLRAQKESEGHRLVPLAAVLDRPRELYAVDAAAVADVPLTHRQDDVRYEDWVDEMLGNPQLTTEGSFVVLAGEQPVAYGILQIDPAGRLAANEMTGTRVDFRRHGLARLAKLATIAWAREQGFRAIITGCDSTNVAMLGLNESLGYRPVASETQYVKD